MSRNFAYATLDETNLEAGCLTNLLDYLQDGNRRITRTMSWEKLLADSAQWHQRAILLNNVRGLYHDVAGAEMTSDGDIVLPPPPLPAWTNGSDVEVIPLRLASEVLSEGARQHNCTGTLIPRIVNGLLSLYRAIVLGQNLTVEVRISEQAETALAPFIALVQAAGLKAEAQWAPQPDAPVGETVAALGSYPYFDEERFAALLPESIHTWSRLGPQRCRCGENWRRPAHNTRVQTPHGHLALHRC